MGALPERLANHWWQRPGRQPGRPWRPHVSIAYSNGSGPAAPVIEALGLEVPRTQITIRSISLVAQTQVGHSWQWQPVAEVRLGTG